MNPSFTGALVGLAVAGACLLVASWAAARRPLPLADRIGPYCGIPGHTSVVDRGVTWTPWRAAARAERPRRGSGHRMPAVVGALVGAALAGLLTLQEPSLVALLALGGVGAVGGMWVADLHGRVQERRRERAVEEQVPLLADLLALAVSAGAAPMAALERAARHVTGPLAADVAAAADRVRAGEAVEAALRSLGGSAPSLRRLVDAIIVALDRGTPLAEVLRAQALDSRADERRRLMESAGRRDVAMLVPIVFLVLPSVVLIAVFPAIRALEVVVP